MEITMCKNCDLSNNREWNYGSKCHTSKIQKDFLCGTNGDYYKFILRRDKRNCENCKFTGTPIYRFPCYRCDVKQKSFNDCLENLKDCWKPITEKGPTKPEYTSCDDCKDFLVPLGSKPCKGCSANNHENFRAKKEDNVEKRCSNCHWIDQKTFKSMNCDKNRNGNPGSCDTSYSEWKLRRDYNQENKEQEMKKYKATEKLTMRNLLKSVHKETCGEVKANFIDVMYEYRITEEDGSYWDGTSFDYSINEDRMFYRLITKTEKRRNWLLKFGFIEEEISLKPCPSCGKVKPARIVSANEMHDSKLYGDDYAMVCDAVNGGCGLTFGYRSTEQEAIKAWNTRKQ